MWMISNMKKFWIAFFLLIIAFLWIIFRSIFVLIPTVIFLSGIVWALVEAKLVEKKRIQRNKDINNIS